MKKALTILLSGFYLLLSLGLTMNLHYCGERLADINIVFAADNCCCGPIAIEKGCCNNESVHFHLDTDQQVSDDFRISFEEVASIAPLNFRIVPRNFDTDDQLILENYDLPPPKKAPAYLLNCSFTFYG